MVVGVVIPASGKHGGGGGGETTYKDSEVCFSKLYWCPAEG